MSDLTHKPELFYDPGHTVKCVVCGRLGKVVTVEGLKRIVQVTIWYTTPSYTGAPSYSAAKTCDGNANWLDK